MTVLELTTEILSRCGEGYENWTDRALAAFKTIAIQLMGGADVAYNCYGLIREDSYTYAPTNPADTITEIAIGTLFGADIEVVKILQLKKQAAAVYTLVNVLNAVESIALDGNSALGSGFTAWTLKSLGAAGIIEFDAAIADGTIIHYIIVAWDNTLLETTSTIISDYFAPSFLQDCIMGAVALLQRELRA